MDSLNGQRSDLRESLFNQLINSLINIDNNDEYSLNNRLATSTNNNSFISNLLLKMKWIRSIIYDAFNGHNYKYFLIFSIIASIMVSFIVITLCMSCYFYRQQRLKGRKSSNISNKPAIRLADPSMSKNIKYTTILTSSASASTRGSKTTATTATNESTTAGSTSPASTASSNLLDCHYSTYDQVDNLINNNQQKLNVEIVGEEKQRRSNDQT
jgi:hypothetical protein